MEVFDIVVIGSGIASTLTLIEVFDQLLASGASAKPLTIAVIEKHHEFWKGIPYGSRSSVNALTITSVHDFIYEPEHKAFFTWLKAHQNDWTAYYRQAGGITAERWLQRNLPAIEKEDWQYIYVPRFLFGNYVKEKFTFLRDRVEQANLVSLTTIQAEATDVKNNSAGYTVILEGQSQSVHAKKVVVAAGSAPVRAMCAVDSSAAFYINDIYQPSVPGNLDSLQTRLASADVSVKNVLIIGSNASSLELLYILEGMPGLKDVLNKVVIISTSGILPYHISTKELGIHPIPNLDKVKEGGSYNIKTLSDAAAEDIKLAVSDGANMDYVATVISTTLKLMEPLGEETKKEFFAIHAIRLRDSFRRAGPEYKNVADALLDVEHVALLKARFVGVTEATEGVSVQYYDAATDTEQTYPLNFSAIINCSGSDNLDRSSSQLLYNIVNNNICKMNLSGKGIEVNEHFEAAPNLYVIGPLLGGNVNKLIHFWQLENASRLTYLAPYLAKELLGR